MPHLYGHVAPCHVQGSLPHAVVEVPPQRGGGLVPLIDVAAVPSTEFVTLSLPNVLKISCMPMANSSRGCKVSTNYCLAGAQLSSAKFGSLTCFWQLLH